MSSVINFLIVCISVLCLCCLIDSKSISIVAEVEEKVGSENVSPGSKILNMAIKKKPKQDDDEDAGSAANAVSSPLQAVVTAIVLPGAQAAATSILKAVSTPFDFLTTSVQNYLHPTTTTKRPRRRRPQVSSVPTDQAPPKLEGQVTYVVISQEQPKVEPVAPTQRVVAAPRPVASNGQEEEEDEENDTPED